MEKQKNELLPFENKAGETTHYRSYIPSDFILASLPLRDVKSPSFQRKMNNVELYITGSGNVPYGKYARLLLSVLTTHAVLQGEEKKDLVETGQPINNVNIEKKNDDDDQKNLKS